MENTVQRITNEALEARIAEVNDAIRSQVATLSDLTDEQRTKVKDIAVAYAKSHGYVLPNISGIANHVRSDSRRS